MGPWYADEDGDAGRAEQHRGDVNDRGQVVGRADTSLAYHAFLWEDGAIRELPLPIPVTEYSSARGINNLGQIVGAMSLPDNSSHAFVYSSGVGFDLNSLIPGNSGWMLAEATDINDMGQIVGAGYMNGSWRCLRTDTCSGTCHNPAAGCLRMHQAQEIAYGFTSYTLIRAV